MADAIGLQKVMVTSLRLVACAVVSTAQFLVVGDTTTLEMKTFGEANALKWSQMGHT